MEKIIETIDLFNQEIDKKITLLTEANNFIEVDNIQDTISDILSPKFIDTYKNDPIPNERIVGYLSI